MTRQPTIHIERVDEVPLLTAHMRRLGLPSILDAHFPGHGNHRRLRPGCLVTIWLAHALLPADHRLNRVRPWADQLQTILTTVLPVLLRPADLTDDRLSDLLLALSDATCWAACEGALNQHMLRVYDLTPTTVRVDSTTTSGHWEVTEDGLFQFGHSKDHRPDVPQIKVMLVTFDSLGMPVVIDVVPSQRSDDPLYRAIIERVPTSLERTGLLDVTGTRRCTHARSASIGDSQREETPYELSLTTARLHEAIATTVARLGWRVYATNQPSAELSLAQVVLV